MSLRKNIIANAAGRVVSVGLAVLFSPLYISILGIEAYGLIIFYITLQVSIGTLEMGLGMACNRELAYQSLQGDTGRQAMRDTLRSLESVYWLIALLLGLGLSAAAPWIANSWLRSSAYDGAYLSEVLVLAGWAIALRWPVGVYAGAMLGLQQHAAQSAAQVFMAAMNWMGGATVLWLYGPDLKAFFLWQILATLCAGLSFRLLAWRLMPAADAPGRFSASRLKTLLPFAAGVGGDAILGAILPQVDKLILSTVLPLELFGYYALASMIANVVLALAEPVWTAVFPRFSQLLGSGHGVSNTYHLACQTVSVLVIPAALVIGFFPREVIYAYIGGGIIAENTSTTLMLLVLARMLHACMLVPYALQMAHGTVRLTIYIHIVLALWLVPAVYFLGGTYGPTGAAAAWLVVGAGYMLVGVPLIHRRLLTGEGSKWAWQTMAAPLAAVSVFLLMVFLLAKKNMPDGRLELVACLGLVWGAAVVVAVLSAPQVRGLVVHFLVRRSAA